MTESDRGMGKWKGKVCFVTGASSGMGEATARRLAAEGLRVAIAARRKEKLDALAAEIEAAGGTVLSLPTDLRNEAEIKAAFDQIRESWGPLDVLVNNAGLGWEDDLSDGKTEEWREMLEVNVLAMNICMREAAAQMQGKDDARILNIASSLARRVPAGKKIAFYSATKYAVRALNDGMRDEMMIAGGNIKVNLLSPGLTATGFHELAYRSADRAKEAYEKFRPMTSEDVAEAICFVLSAPAYMVFDDIIFRSVGQVY